MSLLKLRFKDESRQCFPEWKTKRLLDLAKVYDGTHMTPDYKVSGVPFFSVEHLTNNNFCDTKFISEDIFDKENKRVKLEKGDILMTRIGDIGTPKYINWDVRASFYVSLALIKQSKNINSQYLSHFITTPYFQKELHQRTIHVAFPKKINLGEISECLVQFPSEPEQTKIANFLTAVDEKIHLLTQKHDLLVKYKKGVMQQIFSQELRFKDDDGQYFPEWEEKTMGDIFTFIQTNSFSRELLSYETGIVKNIHYGDIHTKFKSNFKIDNENVPFIKPNIDLSKISADCYCKEGDLLIADASEDYADVGKAIEIISLGNQKLLSGLHTYIARDLSKLMSSGFSGYLMQTEKVRLQIKTLATGVSVLGISKGNMSKVKLNIPTKPEQTKIVTFLTAIDNKITATQTQLKAVKQYKQGLLKQMFV